MLTHQTGMIGLPLRLLAREVYDRIAARIGAGGVALITGEEKRMPSRPRYFVCTVEAMPADREVDFLAVDEIHLAGHGERGHVFTDRILNWRGRRETWLLGADTIRPVLERLVPTAAVERKPRLSRLSCDGTSTLRGLPPRTAVVAFSVDRVYELAERLRVRRGGAAVVMGALSPRARNAQVALYQSGEVDYMVATDAIGMGLNMDVDCVAFADLHKFDGRKMRELEDAELAQIAGRAGRHHNHGKFVTLAPLPPLRASTVRAIEEHRFPEQKSVFWRNSNLDLRSLATLAGSLARKPPLGCLELVGDADDSRALARLAADSAVAGRCRDQANVELLWQVCQIPDYRQLQLDDHFKLLRSVFLQLTSPRGRLEKDWIARHLTRLSDRQGDIDTLLARMAFIRTWTYITHHPRWLDDAHTWQEQARALEDGLSDALHEKLVQRFVDAGAIRHGHPIRGHGALAQQLQQVMESAAALGEYPAPSASPDVWVESMVEAADDRFGLGEGPHILGDGRVLARMSRGADRLHPEVAVTLAELGPGAKLRLQRRLVAWTRDLAQALLEPLRDPRLLQLGPAARGILYQLERGMGTALARDAETQLRQVVPADRSRLARVGIRLGRHVLFCAPLLRPEAMKVREAFCTAALGPGVRLGSPQMGARFLVPSEEVGDEIYMALGYPVFSGVGLRADEVEGLAARIAGGAHAPAIAARLGCDLDIAAALVDTFSPHRKRR